MFTLYIANKNYSSWSLRPWVLMRELGIPFHEKLIPFGDAGAVRAFSPSGRVPCLAEGETTVWDSLAIVEYLAERFPNVWPADAIARAWARSAAAEMHSGFFEMRNICSMNCGVRVRLTSFPLALIAELVRIDELWNDGFTRFGGPFLAGATFTAVDAFYAPVVFRFQTYEPKLSERSQQYVNRLLALPAMKEWYASALEEVWRHEEYEKAIHQAGTLLIDHRRATS
jgi:glutathione S-transferase